MYPLTIKSIIKTAKTVAACFFIFVICALSVFSQSQITTGTIQGTVTDANGAVVPGANVEIKNLDTNFSRTLTTDEDGRFVTLALRQATTL